MNRTNDPLKNRMNNRMNNREPQIAQRKKKGEQRLKHKEEIKDVEDSLPSIDGWKFLGQERQYGYYNNGTRYFILREYRVGTESAWREVLKEANNESIYKKYLRGFFKLLNEPWMNLIVSREDFEREIKRRPKHEEIIAFLMAFYTMPDLKLRNRWGGRGVFFELVLTKEIKGIIDKYQTDFIREISSNGDYLGRTSVDESSIKAVANQSRNTNAMISSAIVSANEAVAKLILASVKKDEVEKSNMYQLISNAGTIIRFALDVRKAVLLREEAINLIVIDLVLDVSQIDKIPGLETLVRRLPSIKSLLKKNARNMMLSGVSDSNPKTQAQKITAQFEATVRKFGPIGDPKNDDNKVGKLLDADTERIAINSFKSSMSIK